MGFFDSLKKKVLKVDDQQLLLEAMLCVAFADGDDQYEETNLVRAFANTLPELKNADAYEIYEKAEKAVKLHGALNRVKELGNLTSEALKHKAFLLAMDIALSSGEIDEGEEAVLAAMAEVMKIPPALAEQIANVLMIKYAT
jgi:tellurite resistance protein